MAHELAQVVQQSTTDAGSFRIQRKPNDKPKQAPGKEKTARKDVVLLGEGWSGGRELSTVLAHGGLILQVNSVDEAAKALAKIKDPIGTLYFVTHSTADGALKFGKDEGFIKATDIAKRLKGLVPSEIAPDRVDFRGCSVGNSPAVMEDIRAALGAQSVVAGNCFAVIDLTTPLKIGPKGKETDITNAVQITKENRKIFEATFRRTAEGFAKKTRKACILTRSEKDFFAAGGRFVALWFNPMFSGDWVEGKSVCYSEAVHQTVDPTKPLSAIEGCRVITVGTKANEASETKR